MIEQLQHLIGAMNKGKTLLLIASLGSLGALSAGSFHINMNHFQSYTPPDSIITQVQDSSNNQPVESVTNSENSAEQQGSTRLGNFPFLRTNQNFIEWKNSETAQKFFTKFANAKQKKFRVLHIGDSHLQADIYTGYVREELQKLYGIGGRGLVFPYSAAKTHSAYDYFTYSKGSWSYSKNTEANPTLDLGVTGYSIRTTDPNANFKLVFSKTIQKASGNIIKIFSKTGESVFDLVLNIKGLSEPIIVKADSKGAPYISVPVNSDCESIEVTFKKSSELQTEFVLYGILIEADTESGVLYASTGVNGAGLGSIVRTSRFEEEVKAIAPDLFVLDLGINDFFGGGFNSTTTKENLLTIIQKVKKSAPNATIMLMNVQDAFNKRTNVSACLDFAKLVSDVAFENDCLFYDIYNVSGGKNSMLNWRSNYLANVDQIHLTSKGYNLKGELFISAIQNSLNKFVSGESSLVVSNKQLESQVPEGLAIYVDNNESQSVSAANTTVINGVSSAGTLKDDKGDYKLHKVLGGESIRSIAKLYNVEISDIRSWNDFYGALSINQDLKIYVKKAKTTPTVTARVTPPTTTPKGSYSARNTYYGNNYSYNAKPKYTPPVTNYSVRNGDTWFAISQRTGIPVNQLKAANGSKGDIIQPGQKIKVPAKTTYTAPNTKAKYGTKYNTNKTTKKTTVNQGNTKTKPKATTKTGTQPTKTKPKATTKTPTTNKTNQKPVKKK
ncbi:hypothetical protein MASR1M107_32900 [Ignavibacteriales bacterium]